jgi:hypothetical protein
VSPPQYASESSSTPEAPPAPRAQPRREEPVREAESPPPVHIPAVPPAPAAAIHAVSEHDGAEEDSHRPTRRRRKAGDEEQEAQASGLQLVETSSAPVPAAVEDELPRRTRPRRRRSGAEAPEPLQLVETQGVPEGQLPDNPPMP